MHRRPAGRRRCPCPVRIGSGGARRGSLHLLTCLPAPAGNRIVVASFYPAVSAWPRALAGRGVAWCSLPPIRERNLV
jgi:hypothetical protein